MIQPLQPPATYTHAERLNWYAARIEEFAVGLRAIADDLEGAKVGPQPRRVALANDKTSLDVRRRKGRKAKAPPTSTVGYRVFAARERAGLTREVLAGMADLSIQTIARVERCEGLPNHYTLALIAKALGTSAEALQGGAQ